MKPPQAFRQGLDLLLRPWKLFLANRRSLWPFKEGAPTFAFAKQRLPDLRTVIDVGASDGTWSEAASEQFPQADVLAFERECAHATALELLTRARPRFDYVLATAGDTDNPAALRTTIDKEIQSRGLRAPFLLRIHAPGFEAEILEGAAETLHETEMVIVEFGDTGSADSSLRAHAISDFMEELGFCGREGVDFRAESAADKLGRSEIIFLSEPAEEAAILDFDSHAHAHARKASEAAAEETDTSAPRAA